ncbi:MAG: hypothetical protein LBP20_02905 [Treponema sp.]|nr:hypothetical protein [Treponema sp.]
MLTKDVENDFVAEVSTAGNTLRNADIAARIVAGRSELRPQTIAGILEARDEIVRAALADGSAVQDGCVRIAPRVSGSWTGVNHAFDSAAHKLRWTQAPPRNCAPSLRPWGWMSWAKRIPGPSSAL